MTATSTRGVEPWSTTRSAHEAEIAPLLDVLELTRGNRNWGFIMRRGHLELTRA